MMVGGSGGGGERERDSLPGTEHHRPTNAMMMACAEQYTVTVVLYDMRQPK